MKASGLLLSASLGLSLFEIHTHREPLPTLRPDYGSPVAIRQCAEYCRRSVRSCCRDPARAYTAHDGLRQGPRCGPHARDTLEDAAARPTTPAVARACDATILPVDRAPAICGTLDGALVVWP